MQHYNNNAGSKPAQRPHPLQFDTCRCGIGRSMACLTCQRWARHPCVVVKRHAEIGGSK